MYVHMHSRGCPRTSSFEMLPVGSVASDQPWHLSGGTCFVNCGSLALKLVFVCCCDLWVNICSKLECSIDQTALAHEEVLLSHHLAGLHHIRTIVASDVSLVEMSVGSFMPACLIEFVCVIA